MRVITVLASVFGVVLSCVTLQSDATARDNGQWQGADPKLRAWFESLKMPDRPEVSCCGDADAYYADAYSVREGRVFATITDNRGHVIPAGTEVEVPAHKVSRDPNMTGHTILFLGGDVVTPRVYCFIPATGV